MNHFRDGYPGHHKQRPSIVGIYQSIDWDISMQEYVLYIYSHHAFNTGPYKI